MAAFTWKAAGGGDWNTAADWTPGGVPGAADTADFATGGNAYTVTGDGSAAALTVDGDAVTFEGAIVAGVAGVAADGLFAINNAQVTINSTAYFIDSSVSFAAGTLLQVSGALVDEGGGAADVAIVSGINGNWVAGAAVALNQLYVNQGGTYTGDLTLNDGGSVTLDTSAVLSGTLNLSGSGALYVANAVGEAAGALGLSEAVVVNAGVLSLATDPGVTLTMSGPISGAGLLGITGGVVDLTGANTYSGGTFVDGTAYGASLILTGATAAGSGAVVLNNASLTLQADQAGAAGTQAVFAAGLSDTITATAGAVSCYSTAGSVILQGAGASILAGAAGGTLTALGSSTDTLVSFGGDTTLNGGGASGNDIYFSTGAGNTVIEPGSGNSIVVAGGASTTVFGGTGTENVFLTGGATHLDFINGLDGGTMNVVGFGPSDVIGLTAYPTGEAQAALASEVVNNGNTILTLSDNTHIVLFGVTGLNAGSFA